MKKALVIALLLSSIISQAQLPGKEAWHWYFGNKGGLDFSSGSPLTVPGIPGSYFTGGCASVSDETTGQYLFTIGSTHIYNKNHAVMTNGYTIYNGNYNTQDVIVLKPGTKNIFYVFVPDHATLNNHGVTYSIVDMNLSGGLGAVTSVKNKVLTPPPTTEKVAAVRHCNGIDYWIITHPANSNAYYSYLLSSSGLDTTPVISPAGIAHQFKHSTGGQYFEGMGCLKASPNGKKLASAIQSDSLPVMEILDFDNSNGVVSNPIQINYPGYFGPWGASFSPDNSKLYCMPYHGNMGSVWDSTFVYQYDLSSGVPSAIIASQTLIYDEGPHISLSQMQIAPDGKIYISRYGNDTTAIIQNPNLPGAACSFQYEGIKTSGYGNWGLPNLIDANYAGIQISIPDVQQCNTFTTTTIDAGSGFTNYFWSTGASTQTISITSPGQYWVTVTKGSGCTRADTVNAYLLNPIKKDTLACDTFHANVVQAGVLQYNWYDGSHAPVRDFTQSGTYYVDINYLSGCAIRDSITVSIVPSPQINIGPDTAFCKGELKMDATCSTCNYQWSTGETTATITTKNIGTYWVKVKDSNGCVGTDSLTIRPQLSAFNFVMPNIVTPNDDKINDEIDFSKYQFSAFQLRIFNRWGQEIFKSEDPNAVWKPTQDDGTYYYTAQYKIDCTVESQAKSVKGFITVVR
ncbi:MAG: T9SS type B sorting domain-containing protein [Bacteroidia bacterium]